jgi:hypothetical protein
MLKNPVRIIDFRRLLIGSVKQSPGCRKVETLQIPVAASRTFCGTATALSEAETAARRLSIKQSLDNRAKQTSGVRSRNYKRPQ